MKADRPFDLDEHQKRFLKILDELSYGHSSVLNDWAEMSALALHNGITGAFRRDEAWQEREKRYLSIVKRYEKPKVHLLSEMFHCVASSLTGDSDEFMGGVQLHDCLGQMYMREEMRSRWDSDVAFTPWNVALMMAKMVLGDNPIPEKGYLRMCEPAAGTGVMVIAAAQALKDLTINYQKSMWWEVTEIRAPLAHMCYIQLSLLHIPAVVIHGDSLSLQRWSVMPTPAHVLGLWNAKLRRDMPAAPPPTLPVEEKFQFQGDQFLFDFERGTHEETARAKGGTAARPAASVTARPAPPARHKNAVSRRVPVPQMPSRKLRIRKKARA